MKTALAWRQLWQEYEHRHLRLEPLMEAILADMAALEDRVAYWRDLALTCEANHPAQP